MELPDLYRKVAFISKKDTKRALDQFTIENRWKENASIIDIGSGDGSTTKTILEKYASPSYTKIVGCDISSKMVKYANAHFGSERIKFIQCDIVQLLPQFLKGEFDHAFSFYVLQRIQQQKAAFSFIYDCLKDGGSCLLVFLGRYPVYDVYRTLARKAKWAEDLKDVETFISPYHDSQNPMNVVRNIMDSIGFKGIEVNVFDETHTYDDANTFKCLVKAINPFNALNERWDEFMQDYFEVASNNAVKIDYQVIVAYGSK
ncbi:juvenile hormone acid O-methyltransferase-like [Leguminivora glycinivorella]|uniref:juvenile hormone acid O-methyltransferase-like n=1 Tax=Leguminivora glycinivorella TaxID=1035111 RepID=UPI0020109C6B|nr:juvenile hormone acid O-methyltransferase-like [Leguminivora glycinivorella]